MIDPETIACKPRKVRVNFLNTRPWLWVFSQDDPPPLIEPFTRTINETMIANRDNVTLGKVVSWTDHGNIAVVEQDGVKAAFWSFELSEDREHVEV